MDRRNFLRSMLGVAAATALPSEVWPFRKIFLPTSPVIVWPPALPSPLFIHVDGMYLAQLLTGAYPSLYLGRLFPSLNQEIEEKLNDIDFS